MRTWIVVFVVLVASIGLAVAADGTIVVPDNEGLATKSNASYAQASAIDMQLGADLFFLDAAHAASGIAMRNRTQGLISMRGVPSDREVIAAYVYVNFSSDEVVGPESMPILFEGTRVQGEKVAESSDPCWGLARNHSYRFDVTDLLGAQVNGEYEITMPFCDTSCTSGESPWPNPGGFEQHNEGAGLVVIYEGQGAVWVYDGLDESMFSGTAVFDLVHPEMSDLATLGSFTMLGADGQLGLPHSSTLAANELTFFDGEQIAGPPVAASDWDGSGLWPLNQLWDVHTHPVLIRDTDSEVRYQSNSDCLVPVAFVLEASGF